MLENLENIASDPQQHRLSGYLDGLFEEEEHHQEKHLKSEQLFKQPVELTQDSQKESNSEQQASSILVLTIGKMKLSVLTKDIDSVKHFNNRLIFYNDQSACLFGKASVDDKEFDVIRGDILHPNIDKNNKSKDKKLIIFHEYSYALLCDEVEYIEAINEKELLFFDKDSISSWFIGVYKSEIARLIDLKKLVEELGLGSVDLS